MLSRASFPALIASSVLALGACGTTDLGGGETATTSTSTTTTASGTTTDTGAAACLAASPPSGPCAPPSTCAGAGSACLAETIPGAATSFGVRVAHLAFARPAAFNQGTIASMLAGNVTPNEPSCNLQGAAHFSWLIRFDTAAGTITTGGAKPLVLPGEPYHFVDEMVSTGTDVLPLAPITVTALFDECGFVSAPGDVILPVYLDATATQYVLIPLRNLRFHDGVLSPDHACIGRYNAADLDPANACQPDNTHPTFVDGAAVDARIDLEDADKIFITPLQESLCVLLSGDPAQFGDGAQPIQRCKRDAASKIVLPGDWCSVTNQAAAAGCADAMRVSATIAARAVAIQ